MDEHPYVLIVDDQPENLAVLGQILRSAGYQVRATLSGELALRAAVLEAPDVVLLDVMMPGMDGYTVCERLKGDPATAEIPVLFVSALSDAADKVRAFAAGGVDFIGKPFDQREVLARVSAHAGLHRARRDLEAKNRILEHALDELRETQAALVQAEKMASLGALVAGAAHALNTPLGNTVTAISTLHERVLDMQKRMTIGLRRSELETFLQDVDQGGRLALGNLDRIARLIEDFKKLAIDRSQSQRRVFSLKEAVVDGMAAVALRHPDTGVAVELRIPDTLMLDSYPSALAQVVTNLLENAFVHAFAPDSPGHVSVDAEVRGERVTVEISDDGRGVPAADLPKIFDPFFTTRLGSTGTGLGLSVAHGIVTSLLGGSIEARSVAGEGMRLKITLPVQAP